MNIILLQDVPGLGFKDEIVKVKNGYGRNYIIPKGFGVIANKSNSKILEENLKQTVKKQEESIKNANKTAKNIGELVLEIKVKTGVEDKIFGSVTTAQISKLLLEKGFEIHKKNIYIQNKVNSLGKYDVSLKIHKDITHDIKINVTGSIESKKVKSSTKEESKKKAEKEEKTKNKTVKEEEKTKNKKVKKSAESNSKTSTDSKKSSSKKK
ncbi:MAG: 50S ribosomal protein L9 [Bacteroidota bacterium]|nr:50S ribosomal protein L9 [Bacteroidota bacterium]